MLRTLVTFCCLFAVPTMAYRTPLRSTASSKTKIFGEALSSVLSLVPSLLPIAGQMYLVNLLTQSLTKDITAIQVESKSEIKAVQVESKSDLKAVLGELKAEIKAVQVESKSDLKAVLGEIKAVQEASIHRAELNSGEMKAVQEASIHRAELNSGEMKVLLATVTRLASLVENADARNLRDL
jgi:predicted transcriptional regulator